MSEFDWNAFASEMAVGTPSTTLLQKFADSGALVPPGRFSRYLLSEWANLEAPLRGGLAKFEGGYGFRLNGESDAPFLTLILRDVGNAKVVLSDLKENDSEAFRRALAKIRKAASAAESSLKGLGRAGSPVQAKVMMEALHKRIVALGTCVSEHFPGTGDDREPRKEAPAPAHEQLPCFEELKRLLTGREEWSAPETAEGIRQLHRAAARERLDSGRAGRFCKLERDVFGDPKPYFRRKRGMGLGFAASALYGPEHGLFKIAGLHRDHGLESRVWEVTNWKSLLEQCDGVDVVELDECDLSPGSTDVRYWVAIWKPAEFARELRERILRIGVPGQTAGRTAGGGE